LLDSLRIQTLPVSEVLFVADNSSGLSDSVQGHARDRGIDNVCVLNDRTGAGVSSARNLGVSAARGEIVAFLDDDTVADSFWCEELVKTYQEHSDAVGVAGAAEPLWQGRGSFWLQPELYWLIGCTGWMAFRGITDTWHGASVNVSYRRDVFERVDGFLPSLGPVRSKKRRVAFWRDGSGEDNEFSHRVRKMVGGRFLFNEAVKVFHKIYPYRLTPWWMARRAFSTGWSRALLTHLYGRDDKSLKSTHASLLRRLLLSSAPFTLRDHHSNLQTALRRTAAVGFAVPAAAAGFGSYWLILGFEEMLGAVGLRERASGD
jgi:glycosyltransferase involved in cell wall biosynthesis